MAMVKQSRTLSLRKCHGNGKAVTDTISACHGNGKAVMDTVSAKVSGQWYSSSSHGHYLCVSVMAMVKQSRTLSLRVMAMVKQSWTLSLRKCQGNGIAVAVMDTISA